VKVSLYTQAVCLYGVRTMSDTKKTKNFTAKQLINLANMLRHEAAIKDGKSADFRNALLACAAKHERQAASLKS